MNITKQFKYFEYWKLSECVWSPEHDITNPLPLILSCSKKTLLYRLDLAFQQIIVEKYDKTISLCISSYLRFLSLPTYLYKQNY